MLKRSAEPGDQVPRLDQRAVLGQRLLEHQLSPACIPRLDGDATEVEVRNRAVASGDAAIGL